MTSPATPASRKATFDATSKKLAIPSACAVVREVVIAEGLRHRRQQNAANAKATVNARREAVGLVIRSAA